MVPGRHPIGLKKIETGIANRIDTMKRYTRKLSSVLQVWQERIKEIAREAGLDFYVTIFEMLDFDQMNEVASYLGFPSRYPHWRFGMEYEEMQKSYSYGLHRIYEMVINNDPAYAYLLESNNLVDQKLVMAHVYAHVDFFKNNAWFAHTNRHMMDEMANHATRIQRYIERYGTETVEDFIDTCLSLENLIDYYSPYIRRKKDVSDAEIEDHPNVQKLTSKPYMDKYINPPEFIEQQKLKIKAEQEKQRNFPQRPEKDVLNFILNYAPLKSWQQDVLAIIREEAYYFAPQGMTKIMNEGWATFWHTKLMTEKILSDSEIIDYADHHSGTVSQQPGRLNPYRLGVELFRDIRDRWDKGKFGKEYEECDDWEKKKRWNREINQGLQKIFEVRKYYNDITFIDTFFTEEFAREHKFFTYKHDSDSGQYVIESRDFKKIKEKLLFSLTNLGQPYIEIIDANYENRSELYLKHRFEGVELHRGYAQEALKNLFKLWTRPVVIETAAEDKTILFRYDGNEFMIGTLEENN